jgi:hypothetical protein
MKRVAVGLRVHGDRADAHLLTRADHTQGNLSAIGNQNLTKHVFPFALLFVVIPAGKLHHLRLHRIT